MLSYKFFHIVSSFHAPGEVHLGDGALSGEGTGSDAFYFLSIGGLVDVEVGGSG